MVAKATRPRLEEWTEFADALKELVTNARLYKRDLAQALGRGFDRGRVGAILEAREPCPEEVLIRVYRASATTKYERLRDVPRLQLLVGLWARAARCSPGPLLRAEMQRAGTPWAEGELSQDLPPTGHPDGAQSRPLRRRTAPPLLYVVALLFAITLIAFGATVLRPGSDERWYTASDVTHSFAGDHAGPVHVTVTPLPADVGRDFNVDLRWGPWSRQVSLPDLPSDGVTLWFTKTKAGTSIPLSITVSPRARVRVGTGQYEEAIDVNDGWVKERG